MGGAGALTVTNRVSGDIGNREPVQRQRLRSSGTMLGFGTMLVRLKN